ncbi:MAG TPA: insulinase family protein [Actinomycetota bacterium]|nr:insulinase family protein [Actinomycetota bacterium]
METKLRYEVGSTIGGYRVDRVEPLENLKGTYYELTHVPTGARHIHIEAPDDSKAFNVAFPTVPKDSRGVAHILEHVVLAGSERFPVRDPFFSMTSRSVRDFMNAMTFSDTTAYPFCSRNDKDFHNLLEVYLDACFFPRIEESSFKQEGHRLEFEQTDDPTSGLRIKGVVFNEMKGAMASSQAVLGRSIGKALMPGSTYANNSGGDPAAIPDLTWQDLRDFHATHYHPSNALFYTYGDMDLPTLLGRIEELALSRFERIEVDVSIPDQPRFTEPATFADVYPLSPEEDPSRKTEVLVAWLTTSQADPFEALSLEVLSQILVGNAAAPLRKALIDSGLGDALATGSGYSDSYKQAVFGAGLKGTDPEHAEEIERIVLETLARLVEEGIDRELVDAAIHQFELHTREVTNSGFPYSLRVWFQLKAAYLYGGDPYRALQLEADFDRLHAEVSAGPFFEGLIRRHLLDNPHRARLVVAPDPELETRQQEAERQRVEGVEASLSEDEKRAIVAETLALKEEQETKQDLSVLPTLEPTDVPLDIEEVALEIETINGATVAFCPQPTNGLSYVALQADFSGLDERLKGLVPVFARALSRVGAGEYDYVGQAVRVDSYTGGIAAFPHLRRRADGSIEQAIGLNTKALVRNHKPFMEILRDVLSAPRFEAGRLRDIIAEQRVQTESAVIYSGHAYAAMLAGAKLTPLGALNERLNGLTGLTLLKDLSAKGDDLSELIADLEAIAEHVFRGGNLHICVTGEERSLGELRDLVAETLSVLPGDATPGGDLPEVEASERFDARTTSVPVTYNAKMVQTVGFGHPDSAKLNVLGNYLKSHYLHREIREKGGAYGSFASQNAEGGIFAFMSYRDPNVARTFRTFDEAVKHAIETDLDPTEVKEAVLQSLSQVDPLLSPDTKGRRRFFDDLAGYTREEQARFKEALLSTAPEDLSRVAAEHVAQGRSALGSVGNAQKIEEANAELGGLFEIGPV